MVDENEKHGQGTHSTKMNWPKITQMPQNVSAQIICPSPKVWDFDEKRLHWAFVVRGLLEHTTTQFPEFPGIF